MGLLHRSLTGALLVLVILLVRAVAVNRLPKAAFKALWAVAAARLLLPFSVASRFSLYNIAAKLAGSGPGKLWGDSGIGGSLIGAGAGSGLADGAAKPDGMFGGVSVTGAIYFLGVCVLACCFLFSYLSCWRKFRVSIPVRHKAAGDWLEKKSCGKAGFFALGRCRRKPEIRVSDRISSPLTYGILHPVILLPKRMDWEDERALGYILDHEYVHILHFDALNKVIFAVMLCVHWFNPLVWGMYFFANRDMELYCDETVVRMGGESAKESYALALLRVEELRRTPFSLHSCFGSNAMEERIVAIMKMKKNSILGFAFAAVLVAGTATLFATSALAQEEEKPEGSVPVGLCSWGIASPDSIPAGLDEANVATFVLTATPTPVPGEADGVDANDTAAHVSGAVSPMASDREDETDGNMTADEDGNVLHSGYDGEWNPYDGTDVNSEADYYLKTDTNGESAQADDVPANE